MRTKIRSAFICLVIAFLASGLKPGRCADDPSSAARASLERIQTLRKERPGDGLLVFYEALARINLGERDAAFDLLRSLKGRKLGLIPVRDLGFEAVWDDPKFQAIRKEFIDEEPKTTVSHLAFRLADPKLIPEGIAFDSSSKRFFLGSVAQHKIVVTDAKGNQTREFSKSSDKLDAVLGLAVDAGGKHLCAVSTNGFEDSAKKERRNAVVCYDLKDGRLLNRFAAPEAIQLNDLAIAPDGTVYATDSASGTIFCKKLNEKTLTPLGKTGSVRGANGIALSADGMLDATSSDRNRARRQNQRRADETAVTGHGGNWRYRWPLLVQGDLIGVQNGPNPGRVVRIALTDRGSRIAGLTVLQSHHHPEFDEPTTGAIANGELHVIGNSYVGHYQPDGTIKDAGSLKGTAIIAVPLEK